MNKIELTKKLRERCGLTRADATELVRIFFSEMTNALATGDRVEIRGFCSFKVKEYNSYTGINPKTGNKIQVPPKKLPVFKCGKALRNRLNLPLN